MKVTCPQESLARGLAIVGRAVASRTTLPILANILLETDDGRLKLSATNLEIGIHCWVAARVEEQGAITVPARLLADFVNSLPKEPVSLELPGKGQTLKLAADRFRAEIKGLDAADFPILPTVEQGLRFTVDAAALRAMITQVSIAAATDESRPILTGILMLVDPDAGRITMAAADGFRLSVRSTELATTLDRPLQVIVPARALHEVARVATDDDPPIEVAVTETRNQALFQLESVSVVSQLIDGNFPDFEKIVPTSYSTRAVVNTKAMQSAVRVASLFARDAANVVRLALQPGDDLTPGTLVVSAQAADVGGNQSEVPAAIEGNGLEIAFNAKYLLDLVGVASADQLALELSTASSPGIFRPVSDDAFIHVVMPMHLSR
jgi:DNA polymerase III subunit beta